MEPRLQRRRRRSPGPRGLWALEAAVLPTLLLGVLARWADAPRAAPPPALPTPPAAAIAMPFATPPGASVSLLALDPSEFEPAAWTGSAFDSRWRALPRRTPRAPLAATPEPSPLVCLVLSGLLWSARRRFARRRRARD